MAEDHPLEFPLELEIRSSKSFIEFASDLKGEIILT